MSMGTAAMLDKERVRHALAGELVCGEDEHGFEYVAAPREKCERFILTVVDKWYYYANELAASGRAMERVMSDHGFEIPFKEYFEAVEEEKLAFDDYTYESEVWG